MHMKKFTAFFALLLCCSMSFAEPVISFSASTVDFGTVVLENPAGVGDSVAITLHHTGLMDYCGVYFEDATMPEDGALLFVTSDYETATGFIYPWVTADYVHYELLPSTELRVHYFAEKAGQYTGTIAFNTYADEYWETETEKVYLTIKVNVIDKATAIDNTAVEVKATKRIINGQLFIEKNGKFYNAIGVEVK